MAKMYLEINNGGKDILVTDEHGHWYYAPVGANFGEVDIYPDAESYEEEIENVLYHLRKEIEAGTTYGAQDFLDDMNDEERAEREVKAFHGFQTIDEVDDYENFTDNSFGDHVRLGHDESYWFEV